MAGSKRVAKAAPPPPPPPPAQSSSSEEGSSSSEENETDARPHQPHSVSAAAPKKENPPPSQKPQRTSQIDSDEEDSAEEEESSDNSGVRSKKIDPNSKSRAPQRPPLKQASPPHKQVPPLHKKPASDSCTSSGEESDSEKRVEKPISGLQIYVSPKPAVKLASSKPTAINKSEKAAAASAAPFSSKNKMKQLKREHEPEPQEAPVKMPKNEEGSSSIASKRLNFLNATINALREEGVRTLPINDLMELLGDSEAIKLDKRCKKVHLTELKAKHGELVLMKDVLRSVINAIQKSD